MIKLSKFPYSKMRKNQKELFNVMNKNDQYKYYICELPTGMGKSAIAKTISSSFENSFIITSTKQLQDQYLNDFKDNSIASIKGKSNYECSFNRNLNCESGYCSMRKEQSKICKKERACPYFNARDKALNSKIMLTSYQYFLMSCENRKIWKPRDVIIFDECHLLESQIIQWATIKLSPRYLIKKYNLIENNNNFQDIVAITSPPESAGFEENEVWLNTLKKVIFEKRNEKYLEIQQNSHLPFNLLTPEELDSLLTDNKDYFDLNRLYGKLSEFLSNRKKDDWIIDIYEDGLELTPLNVEKIFSDFIDKMGIKKIIFMSATILDLPGFRKTFGLDKDDTFLIRSGSEFDPKKSPIHYMPICKMNYSELNNNLDKIADAIQEILNKHPNEKGIIHTGNSTISKYLQDNIKSDRLLVRYGETVNNEIIKIHNTSNKPTVLVSSSLSEGVDLKNDLSRFQVIVKLPWKSLADKRVSAKIKSNGDWYTIEMFKTLIQQCGRSTRTKDDYSTTYILDLSFKWWLTKSKQKGWFQLQFLKRIIWNK